MEAQTIEIDLRSYPKTKKEWWIWLEHDWINIIEIIKKFTKNKKTIEQLIKCKETKDGKIKELLETCWEKIPESFVCAKDTPGLCTLCELVSEIDILEREDIEQRETNREENIALFKHRYEQLNSELA